MRGCHSFNTNHLRSTKFNRVQQALEGSGPGGVHPSLNRDLPSVPLFHCVTTYRFAYLGWQFYGCVMIGVISLQSHLQVFFGNVGVAFGHRD